MRIVAIGASGNAGREIVRLLAPSLGPSDELVLSGRDRARLEQTRAQAAGLAQLSIVPADLTQPAEVAALVKGADLVIVTASRPDLTGPLAQAVLDAGADWFDTMLSSPEKLAALRALEPMIQAAGLCFVTDGGFHPGLPGALVRWAGEQLDELSEADVMGGLKVDWRGDAVADSTIEEMLTEFDGFDLTTWVDGERRGLRWAECPVVDFGPPIGRQLVVPMPLAEMDTLPQRYPGLQRCGFYITGFGPAMDYIVLPLLMVMTKIGFLHRLTVVLARWAMTHLASSPPPHRLVIQTTVMGQRSGRPATASVRIAGEDAYLLTAAPAVVCLRRMIDRSHRPAGVQLQADMLTIAGLFDELATAGLEVETAVAADV